jgi:pimeloyl-ACP methyl ester carboxylesterase
MDTGSIHITRWGQSGPRVILVHGGAQGGDRGGERNFAAQKSLAERGWRLVVPDRPGHGRSPDPGRPDDAEADGAWVADLLEDGAHLVGHSFGGCVALAAAAKRPGAVRSLTLIEPATHGLATSDPHVRRFLLRLLMARLFSWSAASRVKRILKILGIPTEMIDTSDPGQLVRLSRGIVRVRIPSNATLQRELGAIKEAGIPLLVVTGGWSPAFEASSDVVSAIGGGRRVVIESPHHFPQLVSDEFNEILATFMEGSDASKGYSSSSPRNGNTRNSQILSPRNV